MHIPPHAFTPPNMRVHASTHTHIDAHMVYFGNHYFDRNSGALLPYRDQLTPMGNKIYS